MNSPLNLNMKTRGYPIIQSEEVAVAVGLGQRHSQSQSENESESI